MVTKKSLVRYVGPNDLMLDEELTLAEKLLLNFKKDNDFSINEIIELYNANRLIKDGNRLNNWSDEHYDKLKKII
ncbi:hypothetical protein [Limosilactobacillus equigenerosi]|uniref:hypothetical protein n=1 Tax=Limosilactobacillus equigenerosi TaxID=417373 RepID=UPI0006D0B071|nr:hypothetical protein [Limosilactobacillus equigenerosi]